MKLHFQKGRLRQVPPTWVIKPKNVGNWEKITQRKGTRADNVCLPKGPPFLPAFLAMENSFQLSLSHNSMFLFLSFIHYSHTRQARHRKGSQTKSSLERSMDGVGESESERWQVGRRGKDYVAVKRKVW
jgi:hypothetical protein